LKYDYLVGSTKSWNGELAPVWETMDAMAVIKDNSTVQDSGRLLS
jgi:hypothetical protein